MSYSVKISTFYKGILDVKSVKVT